MSISVIVQIPCARPINAYAKNTIPIPVASNRNISRNASKVSGIICFPISVIVQVPCAIIFTSIQRLRPRPVPVPQRPLRRIVQVHDLRIVILARIAGRQSIEITHADGVPQLVRGNALQIDYYSRCSRPCSSLWSSSCPWYTRHPTRVRICIRPPPSRDRTT